MDSLTFKNDKLFYIDQTQLPRREVVKECRGLDDGFRAIRRLEVRGAPLLGVFAAYCAYISTKGCRGTRRDFFRSLGRVVLRLKSSRPTAVNLFWALERIEMRAQLSRARTVTQIKQDVLKEAKKIHRQDRDLCRAMARYGEKLIKSGDQILTHCNAGFLATAGDGTALAVIYEAHRRKKKIKVYVDETRPLLQGARLTSWELTKRKVPAVLICDNMAASLMKEGKIDKVFVGADRITAGGDAANKIGTYGLAVLARFHKIPFYIVAPTTTFDLAIARGRDIPIEERDPSEVRTFLHKVQSAPGNIPAYNPAFDVTGHELITAIVTDRGIIRAPFAKNIRKVIQRTSLT